jgi:glycosyltransferase involved in cell wall biosynthesis
VSEVTSSSNPAHGRDLDGRSICVVYDCLFPLTHGGAERWYRVLVDQLVDAGATVTYLTRRQWDADVPEWTGVKIVEASRSSELYDAEGTRRAGPALEFGLGTFLWMVRHRRVFDAVIVANFPFFSLLAVRGALVGARTPTFVDFFEVWSTSYWRTYAGRVTGTVGSGIQRICIRVTRFAQVFTTEGAQQLRSHGFRGDVAVLPGLLPSSRTDERISNTKPESPMVLFVGRHVKHKGVRQLPEILEVARRSIPTLTMTVVSDGPERPAVERAMHRLHLDDVVEFTGPVSEEQLRSLYERASCTIVPSLREGYGLVVGESVSAGTPVVVANNVENLATTLVEPGVNGFVVEPTAPGMAEGIVAVLRAGDSLRQSASEWSAQHLRLMSMDQSAEEMVERLSTRSARRTSRDTSPPS